MRTLRFGAICWLICALGGSALAIDKAELDQRVRLLAAKFDGMQARVDKAIPAGHLRKAQGIVLLDRTKAGFLFAYADDERDSARGEGATRRGFDRTGFEAQRAIEGGSKVIAPHGWGAELP